MVETAHNTLMTAEAAADFLKISKAAFWRAVAAGRLPAPVYPAARAPRWYSEELISALHATRNKPKDQMALRRSVKIAGTRQTTAYADTNPLHPKPRLLPSRVIRALEIIGVKDVSELRLPHIEQLEHDIRHSPKLKNQYPGSGAGINLGQTTCDTLRQMIGAPTIKDAKRTQSDERAAAIERSLRALVEWHRNTRSLMYPDMTQFVEFTDAVAALETASPAKKRLHENALRGLLLHNHQRHLHDCWRNPELVKQARESLDWRNFSSHSNHNC